jgi:drug/metabolite transporter (DMT)-like permease
MIFTGWVVLGEGLNRWGVLGTLLIAAGSYILSLGTGKAGFWAPLKALSRETGTRLMLAVAAIYSCTAALYKLVLLHSDAMFMGVTYPLAISGVLLAGYPLGQVKLGPALKSRYGWGLILGFFLALSFLSLAHGIHRAPATYLIAVKRFSLLLSVVLGGLWLEERPFLPRLSGAALMTAGVVLIALRGT